MVNIVDGCTNIWYYIIEEVFLFLKNRKNFRGAPLRLVTKVTKRNKSYQLKPSPWGRCQRS